MTGKILRLTEVLNLTGLSRSTIDRLETAGIFPARRSIGAKAVGWIESEVKDWIQQLAQKNSQTLNKPRRGGSSNG